MTDEERDRLRTEIVSLEERNAHQVRALNHGASLLQAAREERDEVLRELKAARETAGDLRTRLAEHDRLVGIAVAEFGAQVERFKREAKERDEARLHQTAVLNSVKNDNADLRAALEKLRGQNPAGYREQDLQTRFDLLWQENETLAHKIVDAHVARDEAQGRARRMEPQLAGLRRAANALAREVGAFRQRLWEDEKFRDLYTREVDKAVEAVLIAAQEGT